MITTYDVRWGCDVLRPVYDASDGVDGRVSIEVDPRLAHDDRADRRRGPAAVVAGRPAQPVHQDPGDQGRPAGDRPVPGRGHQRQRHADLLARALPRGDGRLPRRHRAGPGRRPRPVPPRLGGVVLRQPGRHRGRQAAGEARLAGGRELRGKAAIANARLAFQALRGGLRHRALGGAGGSRAPSRSGRCGPPPASRTRRTTTRCTSSSWSTRGVVNTMPEATLEAVADHGVIRGDTIRGEYAVGGRHHAGAGRRGHRHGRRRRRCSRTRASRSSRPPGTSCSSRPRPSSSGSAQADAGVSVTGPGRRRGRRQTWPAWPPGWSPRTPPCGGPRRSPRPSTGSAGSTCPRPRRPCSPSCASCASGSRPHGLDHVVLAGMGGSSLAPGGHHPHRRRRPHDPRQHRPAPGRRRAAPTGSSAPSSSSRPRAAARSRPTATAGRTSRPSGTRASPTPRSPTASWSSPTPARRCTGRPTAAGYAVVLADPDVGGRYSALSAFGLTPSHLAGADVQRLLADARVLAGELGNDDNPGVRLGPRPRQRRQGRPRQAGARRRRVRHRRASATGPSSWSPSRPASRAPASCRSSSRASTRPASPTPARTPTASCSARVGPALEAAAGQRVARRAVPALGVRHRGGRHGAGHQPVRPAERGGVEGEHQQDPRRVRRRAAARGRPGPGRRARSRCTATSPRSAPRPTSPACWPALCGLVAGDGYLAVMAYLDRHGDGDAAGVRPRLAAGIGGRPVTFGWAPAVPALDRPVPQGRPADRRVPAGHRRGRRATSTCPAGRSPSAGCRWRRPSATSGRWPAADRPVVRLHLTDRAAGVRQLLAAADAAGGPA